MISQNKSGPAPDMELQAIRNKVVELLHDYTKVPVVMLDQIPDKPGYPFISYKFIVAYNTGGQRGIEETNFIPSSDARFEYDTEETLHLQPQMTLSITAYSDNELESSDLAQKAHDWFKHAGYYDLADANVTVVSTEAFGNRNTLIVDDYERRTGFDAILRTTDKVKRKIETIETLNISKNYK